VQVKLLRAVEHNEVRPVGSTQTLHFDVRLISATWARLEECVADGRFRADLFHRITTFVIEVPPLRRHKSDIPALSAALLDRKRPELGNKELTSGAFARLADYNWPGNVRELGAVLYRAATLASDSAIDAVHVAAALPQVVKVRAPTLTGRQARDLLAVHGGNVSAAARTAGVARTTFRGWLRGA
jgi:DNA-binding NtrC family response regulator